MAESFHDAIRRVSGLGKQKPGTVAKLMWMNGADASFDTSTIAALAHLLDRQRLALFSVSGMCRDGAEQRRFVWQLQTLANDKPFVERL
jgi:hypothetical protein